MGILTVSAARSKDSTLLLESSETILEIAQVARGSETDNRRKVFYSHLGFHCARFRDYVSYTEQASLQLDHEQTHQILDLFASLLPERGLRDLSPYPVSSNFRLRELNLHWSEIRNLDADLKHEFIRRWLNLGLADQVYDELDRALEECGDSLVAHEPRDSSKRSFDNFAPPEIGEPSYGVWTAAQSMYDALSHCKGCTCTDQHDIRAKLSLGTYRTPTKKRAQPGHRSTTRKKDDSKAHGSLEFDIFLANKRDWQEFRIKTMKETVVRWAITEEDELPQVGEDHVTPKRLDELCRRIVETQTRALQRLVLKLSSGQLFELGLERSNFRIDRNVEPISLSRCFEERHQLFTGKVKRILSLLLSYAVLHFHGTSWLKAGWGSSDIKFFQTTTSKTPLRPFIQTQLPVIGSSDAEPEFQLLLDGKGGFDTGEVDSSHHCPDLVALAVVLIEVYFVTPFETVAKNHGVELIPEATGRISLADALLVFYGDEEDHIEGCRSQIPEDYPLLTAIEKCLDGELWEDEDGNPLDAQTTRPRIYQEVVRPLETHLSHGFRDIPLEDLDKYSQDLDFGNWGQITQRELEAQPAAREMAMRGYLQPETRNPSQGLMWPFTPAAGIRPELQELASHVRESMLSSNILAFTQTTPRLDLAISPEAEKKGSQFFDDETPNGEHSDAAMRAYMKWRSNYDKVYGKFITNHPVRHPQPAVRIAILDTGIDRDNPALDAREENIKGRFNWYNEETKRRVPDRNGHGTFNASLLLDYAPDAELYIAKIADKQNARPSAHVVAKAIDFAVREWKVDIISMSFGWPTRDFEGYDELQASIDNASAHKVLLFAAASNSGGRQGRAYPARSSGVICIHSTDTYGEASKFSPTASPDDMNLATVGESIKSAWPQALCEERTNSSCVAYKSGTSYATAIAAGIAGFLLQYARLHLLPKEALALKRRDMMMAVFKRVAERGPNYRPRDGYYYIELSLNPDNLFGKDKQLIDLELADILRN